MGSAAPSASSAAQISSTAAVYGSQQYSGQSYSPAGGSYSEYTREVNGVKTTYKIGFGGGDSGKDITI